MITANWWRTQRSAETSTHHAELQRIADSLDKIESLLREALKGEVAITEKDVESGAEALRTSDEDRWVMEKEREAWEFAHGRKLEPDEDLPEDPIKKDFLTSLATVLKKKR